jgi:hypothetical protein
MSKTSVNTNDQMVRAIIMEDGETIRQLLKIKNKFVLSTFNQAQNHANQNRQQQPARISIGPAKPSSAFKFNMDSYINEPCSIGKWN